MILCAESGKKVEAPFFFHFFFLFFAEGLVRVINGLVATLNIDAVVLKIGVNA